MPAAAQSTIKERSLVFLLMKEKQVRSNAAHYRGLRIDCHTHIVSSEIRDAYFARTDGYALAMQFPEHIFSNPECEQLTAGDDRLFLCPCVDLAQPIPPQLERVEGLLERCKVVGLKVFLSYQAGKANDARMYPMYEFAAKHRLSVTFHTGLCSLVLPSDQDIEGSSARYIARAAEDFPQVNFIAAHMDDPNFEECIRIVAEHDNIYTDFSGAYETGTKEAANIGAAIALFDQAICSQPREKVLPKMLYGTDFCPPINLAQLEEYDESIERIFSPEEFSAVYYENSLRAFPRLKNYISL
jgi:predicted TIM-barrel fold metal-dependent hydrolase